VIEYYDNNISALLNIIKYFENKCQNIIFSSSCTVYSNIEEVPIKETIELGNIFSSKSPYGTSKIVCEKILYDLSKYKSDWNITSLRYFNPVGCHPSGILGEEFKNDKKYKNLFPSILSSVYNSSKLKIFGKNYLTPDGTPIRDYIHVIDVAKAHIIALKHMSNNNTYNFYNIGIGKGISVLDVIKEFERNGFKIDYDIVDKREGDMEMAFADPRKFMNECNWKPVYNLSDMVLHTINYYNKNT
jgi:UDP-glucose 4-epimerase